MNRFKMLRLKMRLSQQEIAGKIGMTQSNYSFWENGKIKKYDMTIITKLAEFYKVSTDYLLGNDIIYNNTSSQCNLINTTVTKVPVLGSIRVRIPTYAKENIIGELEVPNSWISQNYDYFALQVKGDSMYPRFLEGDMVLLRQSNTCENGQVCAVLVNSNEATLKKVIFLADHSIMLQPYNTEKYESKVYSAEEQANMPVIIHGVAVRTIRDEN